MCSILAVIAVFYISITLAFDFVALRPVAVYNCLDSNGYTHPETSCTKTKISGPIRLVPTSTTNPSFASLEVEQNQEDLAEASLEGYWFFEKDQNRNGFCDAGTMEMHYVQKNMQWTTRVLRPMWTRLADLFRPQFCTAKKTAKPSSGAMYVFPSLDRGSNMGRDQTACLPKTPTIAKTEIQEEKPSTCKRQRERQVQRGGRRATSVWTALSAIYCYKNLIATD